MQRAKITGKLFLTFHADVLEVLVAEYDNPAFGDQERKLIFLAIIEFGQLQPANLSPDDRREFVDLQICVALGKKIRLLLIRDETAIIELEWL